MKPLINPYFQADLDEAKTLYKVIEYLPDELRLKWLDWCCQQASIGEPMRFRITNLPESVKQYLANLYQMINHGKLTLQSALKAAEYLAKTR
jgi:hypothetical protein